MFQLIFFLFWQQETKPLLLYDMSLIQGDIHPQHQMVAELGKLSSVQTSYTPVSESLFKQRLHMKNTVAKIIKYITHWIKISRF